MVLPFDFPLPGERKKKKKNVPCMQLADNDFLPRSTSLGPACVVYKSKSLFSVSVV